MRRRVATRDRDSLLEVLGRAALARRALSERTPQAEDLVEVRVPVPDRPKVLAEITTLAAELGVNIFDLEIAHSVEGDRGVMLLVVAEDATAKLQAALTERGYRSTSAPVAPGR
jgi:prephenate dehydrogenase